MGQLIALPQSSPGNFQLGAAVRISKMRYLVMVSAGWKLSGLTVAGRPLQYGKGSESLEDARPCLREARFKIV
jgi:hypothetical protein